MSVNKGGKPLISDVREPLAVRPGASARQDSAYQRGGMAKRFLAFTPFGPAIRVALQGQAQVVVERGGDGVARIGPAVPGPPHLRG